MYIQPKITRINNIPVPSVVPDYSVAASITGYQLVITGNTTFTLSSGAARAYTCAAFITYPTFQVGLPALLEVDISTVGALGCYPISIADANLTDLTSIGVYVISDDSGLTPVTAVIATADNFLLPGYNLWRRVGTVFIDDATGFIVKTTQSGQGNDRQYVMQDRLPGGIYGPTVLFAIPLSIGAGPCNPNFSTEILLQRTLTPNAITDKGYISPTAAGTTASLPYALQSPAAGGGAVIIDEISCPVSLINTGSIVYVTVVGAGSTMQVNVIGWKEYLGLQAQ
jgi:hypothetical protein